MSNDLFLELFKRMVVALEEQNNLKKQEMDVLIHINETLKWLK